MQLRRQPTVANQSFITVSRAEELQNFAPRGTAYSNNDVEIDEELIGKMSQLIQQSSNYDEIEVVERKQISASDIQYVSYDTLSTALQNFIQTRPTNDYLLHEEDYILNRKVEIVRNLKDEIRKIDNLIPSTFVPLDYQTYKQKQGKKMIQHFKKIFSMNRQIEEKIENFLAPFLGIYKTQLEVYHKDLMKDPLLKNRLTNGALGQPRELGSRPRSSRVTNSATDEKMILEEKRSELNQLELLVFKIVIAVERINYYTMGVINPRDQNLKLIPFFEGHKDQAYDFQSCLKICSLIKSMIERQEQIERQLSPFASQYIPLNRTTVTQNNKSYYFDRRNQQDMKDKHEFREKFYTDESRRRCLDIWHEFSEDRTTAHSSALRINLHVKVINITPKFKELGYQVAFQLFKLPKFPHSSSATLRDAKETWLFTAIDFAETLLKDDLVMIIKVFKVNEVVIKSNSQKINPKSQQPMQLTLLKAYSLINLSDLFFENRMKDGKPLEPSDIRFFQNDQKWALDHDFNDILIQMRYNEFKGDVDEEISKELGLKIQFTFMSSLARNQLALRLDQATIVRQKQYWDQLAMDSLIKTGEKDPLTIFNQEMQQLTIKELRRAIDKSEIINELRIQINHLNIKDKSHFNKIYRIQVYLIEKAHNAQNLKFFDLLYSNQAQSNRDSIESFQSQIATLNKKGQAHFRNECNLRVPITLKTRDLINYRLVFFVYCPIDTTKIHSQISEAMVEQEPSRYQFYPIAFGKKALLDSQTGQVVGANAQEQDIQLYKFSPKKYLAEQIDDPKLEKLTDFSLVISLTLNSQQYSTNPAINSIIELDQQFPPTQHIVKVIQQITNNDLLIYFTRIIYSLLHQYNQTPGEKAGEILKAILIIFKRFDEPELAPFRQLVGNFEERWRGDRDSDRKLLQKLQLTLEKIPEQIIEMFEQPIDRNVDAEIEHVECMLQNMPKMLALVCRLFSREFQTQYANIREKINTYFRQWMRSDLCNYRPDLLESPVNQHQDQMCSKPAIIVQYLEKEIAELKKNYSVNATIAEDVNAEDAVENENPFGQEEDDFQFVSEPKFSISRRETFHNQTNEFKDTDVQMKNLVQLKDELKQFQFQFCTSIKSLLLLTSKYLHEDVNMPAENIQFKEKTVKIIELLQDLKDLKKVQQNQADQNEKNQVQNEKNQVLENQKKDVEKQLAKLIAETNINISDKFKLFGEKANISFQAYYYKRKSLNKIFWQTLQTNLKTMINFIDRPFVLALFDERLLLRKIEPIVEKVADAIIPRFEICSNTFDELEFYKKHLEYINNDAGKKEQQKQDLKQKFEESVNQSIKNFKQLKTEEQKLIETQVKAKVLMLAELIASDTFILLPSDDASVLTIASGSGVESIQEILATKVSLSVYNHLKQYKSQFQDKDLVGRASMTQTIDKIKDTTQSELLYLFIMKIAIFEKKYHEIQTGYEKNPDDQQFAVQTKASTIDRQSFRPQDGFFDDTDILGGLATGPRQPRSSMIHAEEHKDQRISTQQFQPVTKPVEAAELMEENNLYYSKRQDFMNKSQRSYNPQQQSQVDHSQQSSSEQVTIKKLNESMKLGLGAKDYRNLKERQENLYELFEPWTPERRLCFFLNEMEDAISKYVDLKDNAPNLCVAELASLKRQHISLFSVLSLQHLSSLTKDAFVLLYKKRPGCLDRLVKQVRVTTTNLEFGLDEFFFQTKKLQVVEKFCKNVIDMLCEPQNKKNIAELSDKQTYKSIVSQIWVLQLTLLAEQAQVLYDYQAKGSVLKGPDPEHQKYVNDFYKKLQTHYSTQQYLWTNFKDIDDMVLPDEQLDLYSGITGRIIKILHVDLEDANLQVIDTKKLQSVLRPLAMMFVQIDELTFKTQGSMSYRVFSIIERMLKEFTDYSTQEKNQQNQRLKKKQICDAFCQEYQNSIQQLQSRDASFKTHISQRFNEITSINKLYLLSIQYEKTKDQNGNLLAQLICYYELMQLLQQRNLSVSFQNNIKVKYRIMIDNINVALEQAYRKDLKRAEEDEMYICQKQPSQYIDQMKEVKAFMHVEDYLTYKGALEQGFLANLGDQHNMQTIAVIIDNAVAQLVPQSNSDRKNCNQFFNTALEMMSYKRALQEQNYEFKSVISTLNDQIQQFKMYDSFQEKQIYCCYYRLQIDSFLPEEMQVRDRIFIYRTPSGYSQEFIKHDIGVLLNSQEAAKSCDIKPLQPLTSEVRQKYNILPNTRNLSDTPEEVNQMCPAKMHTYFQQNFKKQFFFEQCPSQFPAQFNEEFVITIYEVKKTFPTMTMIQEVHRTFERKIPRVKIELYNVKVIIALIQRVVKRANRASNRQTGIDNEFLQDAAGVNRPGKQGEATTLEEIIQKYITNDDVGGGQPKLLETFFSEQLAQEFIVMTNFEIKRAYFDLFKGFELWLDELRQCVEVFNTFGNNAELHKQAEERLDDRFNKLRARGLKYKLHQLQENF